MYLEHRTSPTQPGRVPWASPWWSPRLRQPLLTPEWHHSVAAVWSRLPHLHIGWGCLRQLRRPIQTHHHLGWGGHPGIGLLLPEDKEGLKAHPRGHLRLWNDPRQREPACWGATFVVGATKWTNELQIRGWNKNWLNSPSTWHVWLNRLHKLSLAWPLWIQRGQVAHCPISPPKYKHGPFVAKIILLSSQEP